MSIAPIQPIGPTHQVSFGNKYGVRELWMNGKLPQVKMDIYGLPFQRELAHVNMLFQGLLEVLHLIQT